MTLMRYDMATDRDVPVSQEDVDRLQRTEFAFGQLQKKLKFYVAEARNGLIRMPQLVSDLEEAIKDADNTASSFEIEQRMETGTRSVLVVERPSR
jgi:hypothetical protein